MKKQYVSRVTLSLGILFALAQVIGCSSQFNSPMNRPALSGEISGDYDGRDAEAMEVASSAIIASGAVAAPTSAAAAAPQYYCQAKSSVDNVTVAIAQVFKDLFNLPANHPDLPDWVSDLKRYNYQYCNVKGNVLTDRCGILQLSKLTLLAIESKNYYDKYGSVADDNVFVSALFQRFLKRSPTTSELVFWVKTLRNEAKGNRAAIVNAVLQMSEYRENFPCNGVPVIAPVGVYTLEDPNYVFNFTFAGKSGVGYQPSVFASCPFSYRIVSSKLYIDKGCPYNGIGSSFFSTGDVYDVVMGEAAGIKTFVVKGKVSSFNFFQK